MKEQENGQMSTEWLLRFIRQSTHLPSWMTKDKSHAEKRAQYRVCSFGSWYVQLGGHVSSKRTVVKEVKSCQLKSLRNSFSSHGCHTLLTYSACMHVPMYRFFFFSTSPNSLVSLILCHHTPFNSFSNFLIWRNEIFVSVVCVTLVFHFRLYPKLSFPHLPAAISPGRL